MCLKRSMINRFHWGRGGIPGVITMDDSRQPSIRNLALDSNFFPIQGKGLNRNSSTLTKSITETQRRCQQQKSPHAPTNPTNNVDLNRCTVVADVVIKSVLSKECQLLVNIQSAPRLHLILTCSHGIGMLRSPKQANLRHWPNIEIINPNIYNYFYGDMKGAIIDILVMSACRHNK